MIGLDVADLVVIASEILGCDTGEALAQADIAAAGDALAQAGPPGRARSPVAAPAQTPGDVRGLSSGEMHARGPGGASPRRSDAAEAAVALMDALLRHPPFPAHREQMAAAAGLQFLAVNGWQANLDVPGAAAIVIQRLASGQLTPAQAASWLAARLCPDPSLPAGPGFRRTTLPPIAQITRAIKRRHRRGTRPSPLIIHIGPGDMPGGVITPVTGPMAFTGHAKKALVLSRQESSRLGRPRGPEHILLGLVGAGDGLAVKALERLRVRPEAVREQVGQVPGQETHHSPESRQTLRVWHAMVDEAVAHGDDYIGTEHFLLALFCDEANAAAQILTGLGAGEREVRAALAELLAESGRERSA
jgi:Clp amino terminal domain, pathogenicity island component